jgi:ketosteroid isomerase-like protein
MKMRGLLALIGFAIGFALPVFAQETCGPDPQLRQRLVALIKAQTDAFDQNDAAAVAATFKEDGVLLTPDGTFFGRQAIEEYYTDLFQNVHFSNNVTTYNDPNSPHIIGTDGNEMWENGEWSMTWQGKGGDPVQGKGYHASIAVREGGVWKKRMLINNVTPAPAATPSPTTTPSNK